MWVPDKDVGDYKNLVSWWERTRDRGNAQKDGVVQPLEGLARGALWTPVGEDVNSGFHWTSADVPLARRGQKNYGKKLNHKTQF